MTISKEDALEAVEWLDNVLLNGAHPIHRDYHWKNLRTLLAQACEDAATGWSDHAPEAATYRTIAERLKGGG